jgi:hypothetical protein
MLSFGVFVRTAPILFHPPRPILYTQGLFLKDSFFPISFLTSFVHLGVARLFVWSEDCVRTGRMGDKILRGDSTSCKPPYPASQGTLSWEYSLVATVTNSESKCDDPHLPVVRSNVETRIRAPYLSILQASEFSNITFQHLFVLKFFN